MPELQWDKPPFGGEWHGLDSVELERQIEDKIDGVYVIFYQDPVTKKYETVRVGSGNIKTRLQEHKGNTEIMSYKFAGKGGALHVSWAEVAANQMEGVEKYLADELNPKVGERFPDRNPVPVNLPWE